MELEVKEIETITFEILKSQSIAATKKDVNRKYQEYLSGLGVLMYA